MDNLYGTSFKREGVSMHEQHKDQRITNAHIRYLGSCQDDRKGWKSALAESIFLLLDKSSDSMLSHNEGGCYERRLSINESNC